MKSFTIGLLGTVLNNDNLGCQALTYSLIGLLERIRKEHNVSFRYVLFEPNIPAERYRPLFEEFQLDQKSFETAPVCRWAYGKKLNALRNLKHLFDNRPFVEAVKKCDFVIDMTQGDSFSDIYGKERFYEWTRAKQLVECSGVPLVLGPQTIGPFDDGKVRGTAKNVINTAALVMTRDQKSADEIASFSNKHVVVGTDLAFMLPFHRESETHTKVKIGINPSGLLCKNKTDSSAFDRKLKTDYDAFLWELIGILSQDNRYELHLIPHVGDEACHFFGNRTECICHKAFESPIQAKNCIAGMDIFIGARMHATIAAFSSGVATIPTSYSRKFSGLYEAVGYPYLIDLEALETDAAIQRTLDYIQNAEVLCKAGESSMRQIEEKYQFMTQELEGFIFQLQK